MLHAAGCAAALRCGAGYLADLEKRERPALGL
jgi:hypothetical protein